MRHSACYFIFCSPHSKMMHHPTSNIFSCDCSAKVNPRWRPFIEIMRSFFFFFALFGSSFLGRIAVDPGFKVLGWRSMFMMQYRSSSRAAFRWLVTWPDVMVVKVLRHANPVPNGAWRLTWLICCYCREGRKVERQRAARERTWESFVRYELMWLLKWGWFRCMLRPP